jgi:hypothetical protein
MARINMRGLKAEIAAKGYKIVKPAVEARARAELDKAKNQLLNDFDQHAVTQEVQSGPSSSNNSNTLGGYGNLFTFIGFDSSADPISPLRSLLARSIEIQSLRKKTNELSFVLKFSVPTKEQIAAVTPSPWSTESWVNAVERGMSGLGKYLYSNDSNRFKTSRSRGGIEAQFDVRSAQNSRPIDYMTGILKRMLKNIENNLKRI